MSERNKQVVFWSAVALLLCLFVTMSAGCTQYNFKVYKTVVAYPLARVEMNSMTQADGNTSNPTTTAEPELDLSIPLVP